MTMITNFTDVDDLYFLQPPSGSGKTSAFGGDGAVEQEPNFSARSLTMKRIISLFLLVIVAGLIPLAPLAAQSGDAPQVRAVLFWRETCGHCH